MKETMVKSKSLALVGIMGALGNILALISIVLVPIASQVAWDLSNLAVVIVGFYAGWRLGALTGFIAGFTPGVYFGPMGSLGILGLFGLMIGKALTGLTVGVLAELIGINGRKRISLLAVPIVLVGYVPEFIFTVLFFLILVPFFIAGAEAWVPVVLLAIAVKAWAEMTLISFFMSALVGNTGFNKFVESYLGH
jgi:riboflavin transporter FmnP